MVHLLAFSNINSLKSIFSNINYNFKKSSKNGFKNRNQRNLFTLKAMQTGAQNYDGVRIGPPPDLPSLLLNNRIVYLGMPLVPAVTELIVAEFLYLQYENSDKPTYLSLSL